MSFTKRRIDITIELGGSGTFGDALGSTVTLSGLRVQANIAAHGGNVQGVLQLRIYGLPLSMMNRLMRIGTIGNQGPINSILVAAGDVGGALAVVYKGTMAQAWADFQSAPEVVLNVIAFSAFNAAVTPVGARSYIGSVDAANVMADLAKAMGLTFENNGVSVMLSNPYFPGTALAQSDACAQAAGIRYTIDRGVLAIWPKNGVRTGETVLVSPETGMVGYPVFSDTGIVVDSMFISSIKNGAQVKVVSSITPACGLWNVRGVVHTLESESPDGAWFTQLACGMPTNR